MVSSIHGSAIPADMTAGELHDRLMRLGADLMARALAAAQRRSVEMGDEFGRDD